MLASAGCSLQLGAGSNPGAYLPLCGCCRHTGMITAQQLGRPVSPTHFRAEAAAAAAAAKMGWSKSYFDQEDLEAERLFDYGLLAPAADRGARLRLAGRGGAPPPRGGAGGGGGGGGGGGAAARGGNWWGAGAAPPPPPPPRWANMLPDGAEVAGLSPQTRC